MAISHLGGIEMTKGILAGLAAVAALLLVAAPLAQAEPAATAEGDLSVASAFWGREPTGCSSISFSIEVRQPDAGGEATEPTLGDPPEPCTISVREVDPAAGYPAPLVCIIALHEYGHLLGEGHSTDPTNVMYPEAIPVSDIPICENRWETPKGQAIEEHNLSWWEWRGMRERCQKARGPYRPHCWSDLKTWRAELRAAPVSAEGGSVPL
jgi:hypothetical protein